MNIISLPFNIPNYRSLQNQILKVYEELEELREAYFDHKYANGSMDKVGYETYDVIQACLTLLNNNFSDNEILEIEKNHNMKIKERLGI